MIVLAGEAREVALAEAQAVLAMVRDDATRERFAELVAEIDDGEVGDERRAPRAGARARPAGGTDPRLLRAGR